MDVRELKLGYMGKIKKVIRFFNLKRRYNSLMRQIQKRMVVINETMELREMTDVYAEYVCKMHDWGKWYLGYLTPHFCEVGLSFMSGYIKALRDNGLEFQNGLVKKRDIRNDMPMGALEYYREDAIKETKEKAIFALRSVLLEHETSKTNVNTIVAAFKKEIDLKEE